MPNAQASPNRVRPYALPRKVPTIGQDDRSLKYRLQRTDRRKTMALRVQRDGGIEVLAPGGVDAAYVRNFVGRRAGWIADRRRYFSEMLRRHPPKELKNGESFSVFGRDHRLRLERLPGLKAPFCRIEGRKLNVSINGLFVETLPSIVGLAIREWYAALTEKKARAIIRKHAGALAVRPNNLKVVNQAARWASCSKNGDIRCNWRLSMMPMPVLEYIIVHELCHLKTRDHSAKFWSILKSVLPDYERRRQRLRQVGPGIAMAMA